MKTLIQIACQAEAIPAKSQLQSVLDFLSQQFDLNANTLTLRIVDSGESQALNKTFRGKDKPTNVLSFPAQNDDPKFPLPLELQNHLGDLVLCHVVIAKEAEEQGKSLQDHYTHLIIHGTLHLLGYDHENDEEAIEMEQLEIDLLKQLNINNPYEEKHHGA